MFSKPRSINRIFSVASGLIAIVTVTILSSVLYREFTYTSRQTTFTTTSEIITQVNYHLSNYITDIMATGDYAASLVSQGDSRQIMGKMTAIVDSRQDIVTMAVFDMDGHVLCNTDEGATRDSSQIVKQQWFLKARTGQNPFYFSFPHVQHLVPLHYPWVISYSREVTSFDAQGHKQERILLIDMNFSFVSNLTRQVKLGKSGYIYIIDDDGNIIYHPKQTLINCGLFKEDIQGVRDNVFGTYQSIHQGRKRLTIIQTVDNCRWKIVGVAYMDELMEGMNRISWIILLVTLLAIVLSLLLSKAVAGYITSPIQQLEREMKQVENRKQLEVPLPVHGSEEVEALSHAYIEMVERIRKLMTDIVTQQELKRKSELDALEAKINPHFLYNTLDSVVWMAERGNTEGVIQMVRALAKLFRISISHGHEVIAIGEELEHVKNYLLIQKMRFCNFDFKLDCEDDLLDRPIIKLLIQPLVENALYHGIKYMVDPGFISVTVENYGTDRIRIAVKDNGVGMSQEKIQSLFEGKARETSGNGIGVCNVQQRIQLSYGMAYGISIVSEIDEGTCVYIILPKGEKMNSRKVADN
ncbi:MAG: sensor histidine kinase [Spirochaetia bacterium]|jgi:two-component system sensor histidine kinase YesM|nr:sensor histidine kinase [Spirochaetia bacterium]